ncbi:hypothetical protein SAMN06295981_0618 [Corynebacterium pollutisoli]|uniref:Uncharacterized protein n=1 Tax=Corynebacterium pollutisoli TaxID=1610489 RepID=A0A1X7IB12_9CORY|nr:hypothetical protein [Corynebacterium pollutisoli]SMG11824.1 hypothetical protein SAMN06295981_0618 [Corynebacterium pollutisoli]
MRVPVYLAVSKDDYLRLTVTPNRVAVVDKLIEAGDHPTLRLSDDWFILDEDLLLTHAEPALNGGEMWQYKPTRNALAPVQVAMIAEALGEVGELTYSHDLPPLQKFFAEAAQRHDAIIIAYQ